MTMKHLLLLIALASSASAQQSMDGFALMNPGASARGVRATARTTWSPRQEVPVRRQSFGFLQQDASVGVPLSVGEVDEWSVSGRLKAQSIDGDVLFPDSGQKFPGSLWDINVSPAYRHRLDGPKGQRMVGGFLSLGSASDKPFSGARQTVFGATAFYTFPAGDSPTTGNRWYLLLNYSNNRQLLNNIPLPGFAYSHESADQNFRAIYGFPFVSLWLRATPALTMHLVYFVPTVVNAQVALRVLGPVSAYADFQWTNQRYLLKDRASVRERLFADEKKIVFGLQSPLSKVLFSDLSWAWSFDRRYFTAERFFSERKNQFEVSAGPVVSLQLGARF